MAAVAPNTQFSMARPGLPSFSSVFGQTLSPKTSPKRHFTEMNTASKKLLVMSPASSLGQLSLYSPAAAAHAYRPPLRVDYHAPAQRYHDQRPYMLLTNDGTPANVVYFHPGSLESHLHFMKASPSNKGNTGRWTKEEQTLFLEGYKKHGRNWKKIGEMIPTRTLVQIRTHAQKILPKVLKEEDDKTSSCGSETEEVATPMMSKRPRLSNILSSDDEDTHSVSSEEENSTTTPTEPVKPQAVKQDPLAALASVALRA